ncbi:TIGR00730 family Rossman fold protein [Hydrocarboniclastica marina]|uniref:Cytokinin riboside 5'-monophosphate phosphoribohydrolase n=1 Tax=Hydrocarboniclastica marina TaxID=2259620 RepID=A0A4P7XHM6_9ALTE|nr:TIGR00730 family Rossman fold protein [Hydrocarboniclastica marina]MAL98505.1 TIGR00730 family Rossman fold protein [Alteromonadaceae bacterium]QCF25742.1 TIGR00730 family Rossman fold protein [Hydrocarboniclastica marina]|tara:strand:+ start:728 stop:1294 length:567 start_codon:yes stop_codon:yes gene_type:complete
MRIAVFCGSSPGRSADYEVQARQLGEVLVTNNIDLVFGGGHVGLMGIIADTVMAAGGRAYGVIPRALSEREVAHQRLTSLEIVEDMHQRKARMAELADGFIALPGGVGTLEELFEVWTWAQLGLHAKPVGLLNVEGFYDLLARFIDQLVTEEFLGQVYRDMLLVDNSPQNLIDRFRDYTPPRRKWSQD